MGLKLKYLNFDRISKDYDLVRIDVTGDYNDMISGTCSEVVNKLISSYEGGIIINTEIQSIDEEFEKVMTIRLKSAML